ncbi:MAG: hypothetical protein KKD33_04350, partial [Verrucomicrobia bacterium]|nr:hypothetical protein [Verrucomicrobiota bacterium]
MNVVFVGGGSFRTLPIVRAAMAGENALRNGKIQLVDFNLGRAETVGRLIMKTPEYGGSNCEITWTNNLDQALSGADLVSISFPVGSWKTCMLSDQASTKYGFHGGDQLSISGAFRSLTGGVIILDIARRMEKHCPSAWLVDHANPVAVYSGLVNNHTKIRALGLCGSCYHPNWDLTRLLFEKDEYRADYKFASAGVNHLTFLLRAEYKGRDVCALLDEKYKGRDWKPRLATLPSAMVKTLHFSYGLFQKMRRRFGVIPCANELDGTKHIFPDEFSAHYPKRKRLSAGAIRLLDKKTGANRRKADLEFRAQLDRVLDSKFWAQADLAPYFKAAYSDPTAIVMKALGTGKPQWLTASLLNCGAVKGFKGRTVLEYSFTLDKNGVHP